MHKRVSGLINGSEGSGKMYSNLTQFNKLSFWGRKKAPPPHPHSKNAGMKHAESFCLLCPS